MLISVLHCFILLPTTESDTQSKCTTLPMVDCRGTWFLLVLVLVFLSLIYNGNILLGYGKWCEKFCSSLGCTLDECKTSGVLFDCKCNCTIKKRSSMTRFYSEWALNIPVL